ncbi:NUDIX domain containing protein [Asbolus verrucosus]|uniref:Oxidized purine nucleoside triphosphate hydrolase n=1 Tax=Asbolus verrucosus TaxID=1661398 RepID=A0A482VRH3_ASBVE|nr:NUDIX domain containing protein [Asbolus verrucosus]
MATRKLFTLVFLKRQGSVLLGLKTRGLGKGLWNGFGGKIEDGESVVNCARRELREECGLMASDLKQLGVVKYEADFEECASIVHVFTSSKFEGEEKASEEMNPIKWYKYHDIPYMQMWPDSVSWYPLMLQEKFFSAHVIYSTESTIRESIIQEYGSINNALKLAQ